MVKILQIVSTLKKNGTENFIMNVFRRLDPSKISFDFLIFDDSKDGFYDEIIKTGSKIYIINPRNKGFLSYHRDLKRFFRLHANEYDGVHMHGTSLTTLAPLEFAKRYNIPLRMMHMHGTNCMGFHNKFLHKLNKFRITRLATHLLSCSTKAAIWGYGNRNSLIIPNGIDYIKFGYNQVQRQIIRQELGIKKDEKMAIHVGMFKEVKNHKFLIEIMDFIKKQDEKVILLLTGTGPLEDNIKNLVKEKNLKENIKFLGHREDVANLLSASDICIFPSFHEGFPFALLESQANGLPVVASTGVPVEVKISENFYFIDLKEGPEKWAEKITEVLKENYDRIADEKIKQLSIDSTVQELIKIYES